jgi:hypothetical protein
MKSFLERLAARDELGRVGGRCSFRDLGMGETAALSHSTLLMALSKIEGPVEGNAEPRFSVAGRKQVAEKTSPGALERKKGFHGIRLFQLSMFCGVKAIIDFVILTSSL